jgi:hypothetical protein
MKTKRLDNIMARQKRNLLIDTLLAALLIVGLGLAAFTFAACAPAVTDNGTAGEEVVLVQDQSPAQLTANMLQDDSTYTR